MANASSIEDVEFIKTLQNDNMYSINYSEIKNIKLVKLIDYGITVKGHWRDRIVLMKHISNLINRNNEALKQLLHKLSIIKHPNILQFLGTSIDSETKSYFAVLEYAKEGNLHDYLSTEDLNWSQKLKISKDIASGLEYLHNNIEIIHQNLSTETIFINNGIAQLSNPVFSELNVDISSSISLQGGMIAFMDSELLKDPSTKFTSASDVYSLGFVMWSISSGKLPFENFTNQIDLANRIVSKNIRENPVYGTPQAYIDLYQRCWGSNPEERPSAQEVYTQLEVMAQESLKINVPDLTTMITLNIEEGPVNTLNRDSLNNQHEGSLGEKNISKLNLICKLFCCGY